MGHVDAGEMAPHTARHLLTDEVFRWLDDKAGLGGFTGIEAHVFAGGIGVRILSTNVPRQCFCPRPRTEEAAGSEDVVNEQLQLCRDYAYLRKYLIFFGEKSGWAKLKVTIDDARSCEETIGYPIDRFAQHASSRRVFKDLRVHFGLPPSVIGASQSAQRFASLLLRDAGGVPSPLAAVYQTHLPGLDAEGVIIHVARGIDLGRDPADDVVRWDESSDGDSDVFVGQNEVGDVEAALEAAFAAYDPFSDVQPINDEGDGG